MGSNASRSSRPSPRSGGWRSENVFVNAAVGVARDNINDIKRTTSVARYYLAHRVGGSPADMGWESQAVRLVPLAQLGDYLNRPEDKEILEFLRARAEQAAP